MCSEVWRGHGELLKADWCMVGMPWRRTKNRNIMEEHGGVWMVMEQEYDRGGTKQECHGACCGVQRRDT